MPKFKDYDYFANKRSINEKDINYIIKNLDIEVVRKLIKKMPMIFTRDEKVLNILLDHKYYSSIFINSLVYRLDKVPSLVFRVPYLDLDKVYYHGIDINIMCVIKSLFNKDVSYFKNHLKKEIINEKTYMQHRGKNIYQYSWTSSNFIMFIIRTNNFEIVKDVIEDPSVYGIVNKWFFRNNCAGMLNNAILNKKHNIEIIDYLLSKMDKEGYYKLPSSVVKNLSLSNIKDEKFIERFIEYKDKFDNIRMFNQSFREENLHLCKGLMKEHSYIEEIAKGIKVKSKASFLEMLMKEMEFERNYG